jgi:phage terminase small subunit
MTNREQTEQAAQDAWETAMLALALLRAEGVVITDARGSQKKHPAFQAWRDSVLLWQRLRAKLDGDSEETVDEELKSLLGY